MNRRMDWVDNAKAIGIILVVYGHVARGLQGAGINLPEPLYELTDSVIYSFHMPLFFFLAGLFFYSSLIKLGRGQLVFSKLDTIVYPYLIWSLLQGSIETLLSNYTNGNTAFAEVLALLWAPRAQFWFLYALFFVFLVSTCVYSLMSKRFNAALFLLAAGLYLFPNVLPQLNVSYFISQNLVFFALGVIFTEYVDTQYTSRPWFLASALLAFILGQWLFHGILSLRYEDRGLESLLLAGVSILLVVSCATYVSKYHLRWLSFIGASSMAIYMMHILAASGIRVIFNKLGLDSVAMHLILGCLVGVLAPLGALVIINRLRIPYVFSAPMSTLFRMLNNKMVLRARH